MKQKNEIHVVGKVEDLVVDPYPPTLLIYLRSDIVQFFLYQ